MHEGTRASISQVNKLSWSVHTIILRSASLGTWYRVVSEGGQARVSVTSLTRKRTLRCDW